MSSKKPLIVFEGIEGSGKTTLIKYISNYLKNKKLSFINIREPGGNNNSEKILNGSPQTTIIGLIFILLKHTI